MQVAVAENLTTLHLQSDHINQKRQTEKKNRNSIIAKCISSNEKWFMLILFCLLNKILNVSLTILNRFSEKLFEILGFQHLFFVLLSSNVVTRFKSLDHTIWVCRRAKSSRTYYLLRIKKFLEHWIILATGQFNIKHIQLHKQKETFNHFYLFVFHNHHLKASN